MDDTLKLSRRLMSSADHIEVASDLMDQGVFMMRNDVAHWVMANAEDRFGFSYFKFLLIN